MNIEELLEQAEGKTLEFKQDLSSPKNLVKTLVAFANTAGGRVIIGVDDKTRLPVGVDRPLDEEERLCSIIADSISPRLVPNIDMITVNDKTLLVLDVFLSGSRPHWLKAEGPEGGVYVRLGSTNRQADRELIAELHRSVEGVAFDELPMLGLSVDDLDLAAITALFRGQRDMSESDLFTLRLLISDQGRMVPTKGAVLLFGKERNRHFPDAWVQCGRFIGRDRTDIFDHIELYGHLPQVMDDIMLFLKKHAMRGADFSEIRRKDVWSIPLGILREAVINALVHTDYSQRGAPIRIAFFDDRIEIENPGILLPGMTIDDMRRGVSKIRNHVIARVFRELQMIEQWGSGVRRMFREAEEQGFPEPQIEEIGIRYRFTLFLKETVFVRVAEQVSLPVGTKSAPSRHQVEILRMCRNERAIGNLMKVTGRTDRTKFRNQVLTPLIEAGWIEMTIPDKPRSSKQKYRLTAKGSHMVQGLQAGGNGE